MPLQRCQAERRSAANAILAATEGHLDRWSAFVLTLGRILATMQELPFHYNNIGRTTESLVQHYRNLSRIVALIKWSGLAAGAGGAIAANAGLTEAVKTGRVKAAVAKAGMRLAGHGALPEAIGSRLGANMPKGGGAGLTVAAIAGATVTCYSAQREMGEIRSIVLHRFQSGQATNNQYRAVFQDAIDPAAVKRYWEMR